MKSESYGYGDRTLSPGSARASLYNKVSMNTQIQNSSPYEKETGQDVKNMCTSTNPRNLCRASL